MTYWFSFMGFGERKKWLEGNSSACAAQQWMLKGCWWMLSRTSAVRILLLCCSWITCFDRKGKTPGSGKSERPAIGKGTFEVKYWHWASALSSGPWRACLRHCRSVMSLPRQKMGERMSGVERNLALCLVPFTCHVWLDGYASGNRLPRGKRLCAHLD